MLASLARELTLEIQGREPLLAFDIHCAAPTSACSVCSRSRVNLSILDSEGRTNRKVVNRRAPEELARMRFSCLPAPAKSLMPTRKIPVPGREGSLFRFA